MWLKRLVAIVLIISSLLMLVITVYGIGVVKDTTENVSAVTQTDSLGNQLPESNSSVAATSTSSSDNSDAGQDVSKNAVTSNGSQKSATNPSGAIPPSSAAGSGGVAASPASGSAGTTGGGTPSSGGGVTVSKPVVTLSISPGTINTGSSATIGWTATNSPASCSASGSWSGTKPASGSQSTGAQGTPGTFTYTLSCSNVGGTGTASVNLKVNAVVTYCGGAPTCWGVTDLNAHNNSGTCWGYTKYNRSGNYASVFNINSAVPSGSGKISNSHGLKGISSSNFYSKCGQDITSCLDRSGGCGNSTRNHTSGDLSNYSQTFIGYYDPNKP